MKQGADQIALPLDWPQAADADRLPTDHPIVAALRSWRAARVAADRKPAYVYLTDATVDAIARAAPEDLRSLARIPGIGPGKLDAYGDQLVEVVREALSASAG